MAGDEDQLLNVQLIHLVHDVVHHRTAGDPDQRLGNRLREWEEAGALSRERNDDLHLAKTGKRNSEGRGKSDMPGAPLHPRAPRPGENRLFLLPSFLLLPVSAASGPAISVFQPHHIIHLRRRDFQQVARRDRLHLMDGGWNDVAAAGRNTDWTVTGRAAGCTTAAWGSAIDLPLAGKVG